MPYSSSAHTIDLFVEGSNMSVKFEFAAEAGNAMTLPSLLAGLAGSSSSMASGTGETPSAALGSDIRICDVTTDPNLCKPGYLYLADQSETVDSTRLGVRLDGRDYICEALNNGASAVLTTADVQVQSQSVPFIFHDQPLALLGPICARLFPSPRPTTVALVTGTNGKTSTVNFASRLWSSAGRPACSVGNLGGVCSDGSLVWERDPTLSVPETVFLHKMLRHLARGGFNHVALEATSHALYDHRLTACGATIGAFTNLTRDHLNFHASMEEYFSVKMRLFEEVLNPGSIAVLNADVPFFAEALSVCKSRKHRIITFGREAETIRLLSTKKYECGQILKLAVEDRSFEVDFKLFGDFQISNALCALAIVIASGLPTDEAVDGLGALEQVEGRLNTVVTTDDGARVVIDYAHTPDGIRAALEACRSFTVGKLIIVFGCDGESDRGKRPQMGEVASKLADLVIVTDDHPRREDAAAIRREIIEGAPAARDIAGRATAIAAGVAELSAGDTLLIAGFGHETFQQIGDVRLPFSDAQVARLAARSLPYGG